VRNQNLPTENKNIVSIWTFLNTSSLDFLIIAYCKVSECLLRKLYNFTYFYSGVGKMWHF